MRRDNRLGPTLVALLLLGSARAAEVPAPRSPARPGPDQIAFTLFLIGDGSVHYGEIMNVIDAAVGGGVTKIGIVTEGMRQEAAAAAAKGK